jgi:hypothetical protein
MDYFIYLSSFLSLFVVCLLAAGFFRGWFFDWAEDPIRPTQSHSDAGRTRS